ncbi:unnamed protein product [Strongylus vulgaris]|uniref:Uncharacterized protein n=1 Tax=Strongylus vulgaris TaxID=40348 RepID=A0A3P7JU83_STRVU|nr:unnamed protein product [Strongylus vulgaris]
MSLGRISPDRRQSDAKSSNVSIVALQQFAQSSSASVRRSRSGRCIHPPLAEWAGERVRYDGYGNVIGVENASTVTVHSKSAAGTMALSNYYGLPPADPVRQSESYTEAPKLAVDSGPKRVKKQRGLVTYSETSDEGDYDHYEKQGRRLNDEYGRYENRKRHYSDEEDHIYNPECQVKFHTNSKRYASPDERKEVWRKRVVDEAERQRLEEEWARENEELSTSYYSDGDADWHEPGLNSLCSKKEEESDSKSTTNQFFF